MDAYAYFTQNYDVEKLSEADQEQLSKAAAKLIQFALEYTLHLTAVYAIKKEEKH